MFKQNDEILSQLLIYSQKVSHMSYGTLCALVVAFVSILYSGGRNHFRLKSLFFSLICFLSIFAIVSTAQFLASKFENQNCYQTNYIFDSEVQLVRNVIVFVVAWALIEEAIFRGFAITFMSPRVGVGSAILLSTILFVLIHSLQQRSFIGLAYLATLGGILSTFYIQSYGLFVATGLHAGINTSLMAFGSPFVVIRSKIAECQITDVKAESTFVYFVILFSVAGVALIWHRLCRRAKL